MYESTFIEILENSQIQPFLPFFFTLAVVYGLLGLAGRGRKGGLFGKTSVNLIIALVFAFFAAGYRPFVVFFFDYFGLILWAFVGLFFIAFFLEAVGATGKKVSRGSENLPMIIIGIFVLLLITAGVGYIEEVKIPYIESQDFLLIVGIVFLVIMIYFAYHFGHSMSVAHAQLREKQKS